MPLSKSQFDNHELWAAVEAARQTLPTVMARLTANHPETAGDILAMVDSVERLKTVDHWRFPSTQNTLGALLSGVTQLVAAVSAYEAAPNDQTYAPVQATRDGITTALVSAPTNPITSGHLSGIKRAREEFTAASSAAIEAVKQGASSAVDDAEKEVLQLAVQAKDLRTKFETIEASGDAAAQSIEANRTNQKSEFDGLLASLKSEYTAGLSAQITDGESQLASAHKSAEDLLGDLTTMRDQGRNLLGKITEATISKQYGEYAIRQGIVSALWTLLSSAVALGSLWFVWHETTIGVIGSNVVGVLGVRSLLTALVGVVSGYMFTIAGHHRENARVAKRAQLDIDALEPYLTNMSEEAAIKLRTDFAENHFLREEPRDRRPLIMINRQSEK